MGNLTDITNKGKHLGEKIAQLEVDAAEKQKSVDAYREENNGLDERIKSAQATLETLPEKATAEVVPDNIPEWVELQKQIADIKATITTDNTGVDTSALQASKKEWMTKRNDVSTRLAKRGAIERCNNEIADLEAHGKDVAQQIADIEREEYTVEQFNKTKVLECEKRINAKFHFVTFRLFDYTLDGNPVETCIPLCNGVPYGSANTASQVNAGLDIINALCAFYGVCAPIFIDNRESVNEIIPVQSQVINLVVTNDNKLTIQ